MKKIILLFFFGYYGFNILLRTLTYKLLFRKFGKNTLVIGKIAVIHPENIEIGSKSTLNEGVFLNAHGGITIGDDVHISPKVIINSAYLDLDEFKKKSHKKKPVIIKNHSWIGSGAIINPGVTVGNFSVIGAGAVVTKDVPDCSVVAGVPARLIKKISI